MKVMTDLDEKYIKILVRGYNSSDESLDFEESQSPTL